LYTEIEIDINFSTKLDFRPTEKGLALQPILDAMAAYSLKYCSKEVIKDGMPRSIWKRN
jgi:hypothetical protein